MRRALAAAVALILSGQPALLQATVRIRIHSGGGSQGAASGGVAPVRLGKMGLGGGGSSQLAAPGAPLSGSLSGLRIRGVHVAAPADLAVAASLPPAPLEVISAQGVSSESTGAAAEDGVPGLSSRESGGEESSGRGKDAARIDIGGDASERANALSEGLIALGGAGLAPAGGGELAIRETVGAAFDGAARLVPQELLAVEGGITASELFEQPGRQGIFPALSAAEADRLAKLSDETAQWRAVRAISGEEALSAPQVAVLRGIDDLARAVVIGRTSPAVLRLAAGVVEGMPLAKLKRFSELAWAFINTEVPGKSTPFARVGNVEHVEQQLLDPLKTDGAELARGFKANPSQSGEHFVEMLRALQLATDTGKQQNPDDMGAALSHFNPQGPVWYINNFILPHEYASMAFVETFGRQAGFSPGEILAFQRLIANHNFGPDLTKPKNREMREHWWAKNFREQMLPMLQAMGIDVDVYFNRDETGALQYNHTQGHPYALLLSAYDRAIAVPGNGFGLATWKKYGTQDFNQKKGKLKGLREQNAKAPPGRLLAPDPPGAKGEDGKAGPIFEFDGPAVIRAMESTADWAETHIESLWSSLYTALPAESPLRRQYPDRQRWRMFPPFLDQRKAIGSLLTVLRLTKVSNPEGSTNRADVIPKDGVAYYEAQSSGLAGIYRVTLERAGPGAMDPRSTEYSYSARLEAYRDGVWAAPAGPRFSGTAALATSGPDPVALLIDLIRADQ